MLLYASNRRLEGWVYLEVGGPVELWKWRSASTLEAAPMWVSPTHYDDASLFNWSQWIIGPLYDESICNDWSPLYLMFFEGTKQKCLKYPTKIAFFINNLIFFPRHLMLNK